MAQIELVQACNLWDKTDLNSYSLPTIAALADCDGVRTLVSELYLKQYHPDDPFRSEYEKRGRNNLSIGLRICRRVSACEILLRARNTRHKLAHPIDTTDLERKSGPLPPTLNRDANVLFGAAFRAGRKLYAALRNADFGWDSAREMHKRDASELWENVRFFIRP